MKYIAGILSTIIIGILLIGCAKDENPNSPQAHPKSWMDEGSKNFHGKIVRESGSKSCETCHGVNLQGGESKKSCFECHGSYPHPQDWLNTKTDDFHGVFLANFEWAVEQCASCHGEDFKGGSSEVACFTCHASFPHPQDWNKPADNAFHGEYLDQKDFDATSCKSCHGEDYAGGRTKIACSTCHATYPHAEGWNTAGNAAFHGQYLKTSDYKVDACASCHGQDFKGGSSEISCYPCHSTYPHPQGWLEKSDQDFHGALLASKDYDSNSCKSCHGENFEGGTSGVACSSCHATFPHPSDWNTESAADFHGLYLKNNKYNVGTCTQCHGENFTGGTSGVSCYTCHTTYPHAEGWLISTNANFHGTVLKNANYDASSCKSCHGESFEGGSSGVSCGSCHATFPHPSGWNTGNSADFHGQYLKDSEWDLNKCSGCHGENFQGGSSDVSCFTCHTSYPHTEGWLTPANANFHGTLLKNANYDASSCKSCHGESFDGGSSEVACSSCHATFPHPSGWNTASSADFHGQFLKDSEWDLNKCSGCHGDNFQGGSSDVSCFTCHATFPHEASWTQKDAANFHGQYLKANEYNTENCQTCHGADLQGGSSEVSCYTCHASYPHRQGWENAGGANFHGQFLKDTNWSTEGCQSCHGNDFQGGSSDVSCYTCHTNYPHVTGWQNTSSPQFHGEFLKAAEWDAASCQSCHGTDYQGGFSEVSCFTCHTSYPHQKGWVSPSGENFHGQFLKDQNWSLAGCTSCHGNDFQGGSSEASCFTCHANYPHASGWMTEASDQFHGEFLERQNWDASGCTSCHGEDFQGGFSETSCFTCHASFPHPNGWLKALDPEFHGQFISNAGWSLESCQSCHGQDYRGDETGESCYTCHEQGPEGCNVCHGSQANSAPPEDLSGNFETTALGVGAHQLHMGLYEGVCKICHTIPANFSDPAHIDESLPAEVSSLLEWDRASATCGNAICHQDETKPYIWNNFNGQLLKPKINKQELNRIIDRYK